MDDVPPILANITIAILTYEILGGREDSKEHIRYAHAIQWLEGVAAGKIDIPGLIERDGFRPGVLVGAKPKRFTDETLLDFNQPLRYSHSGGRGGFSDRNNTLRNNSFRTKR